MDSIVYPIRSQTFALDESKIERRPAKLESLELVLDEAGGSFFATLKVGGADWEEGNIAEWEEKDTAVREFQKIVEAFAEGHYKINLYEGKPVEVNVKY